MREQPIISVIIPVFNTAAYLPRCLDSVLNNTYRNLEVLCINDGSTDNSAAIVARYAQVDSRVVLIDQKNAGVSVARNAGLDAATGEFIAFIDSDDWVHPQYFELLTHVQKRTNADVVAANYLATSTVQKVDDIQIDSCSYSALNFSEVMKNGYFKRMIWGRIYRKDVIKNHRFPAGIKWGEDTIFNVNALSTVSRLNAIMIDEKVYFYFQRESSAVHTLKTEEKVPVCEFYLAKGTQETDRFRNSVFMSEFVKQICAHRYSAKVCNEKEVYQLCKSLIKQGRNEFLMSGIPFRTKMVYSIFLLFPWAYRCFRIIDDPTLIQWERFEKKRNIRLRDN